MSLNGPPDLALVLADPRRVADLRANEIPALLGTLEQVRAALWARMIRPQAEVVQDSRGAAGDQLLTVAEVAAEAKFTPGYVYDAVRRGQLSAVRKGKYVRIRRADLQAWLEDGVQANGLDPVARGRDSSSLHASRSDVPALGPPRSPRAVRATRARRARPTSHERAHEQERG
jgi:excisionase family DNA binding protein